MKNYDFLLILSGIFISRIVVLSATYADALCLTALFAYKACAKYMEYKKVSNEVLEKVSKDNELIAVQIKAIAEEAYKAKNAAEGLKAAVNFNKR